MLAEIKTLLWLQWKLTISMFRSRRAHVWARLGSMLLAFLMLVSTTPFFAGMAVALGYGMTRLSPQGAYELIMVVNCAMLFLWLLLPGINNSQIIERFELARLFVHPISFRSIVAGSTLVSLLTFVGPWTALILLGEIFGLAWHSPWAIPLILLGAVSAFAMLVFTGRLMEDVFELVSSDRRLRGLMVFFLTLPFILLFIGYYYLLYATNNFEDIEQLLSPVLRNLPSLDGLGFTEAVDLLLLELRPSRYLIWLPPGWATAGMALAATGRWGWGLLFLALSLICSAGLLWAHAAITRRMMQGAVIRSSAERVRSQRWRIHLPGPPALWVLFRKDWTYLRRSPVTKRTVLIAPIVIVAFGFALWQVWNNLAPGHRLHQAVPVVAASLLLMAVNMATCNLTANFFGAIDREGFASLMLTPTDRRQVLLSANLLTLVLFLAQSFPLLVLVAAVSGSWGLVLWGLFFALCLHVSTASAYNLTSIIGPYRAPLWFSDPNKSNVWVLLAWAIAAPPVLALFLLPYFLWPEGQVITLPLAAVYAFGVYALTLKPVASLIDRRTHQILEAVTEEG